MIHRQIHWGRVKIYRIPGPGLSGGRRFFSKKNIGGGDFFSEKIKGRRPFVKKIRRAKTLFTIKFENPRFHFSKKAIFEDQKVTYVGLSDSYVFIGV